MSWLSDVGASIFGDPVGNQIVNWAGIGPDKADQTVTGGKASSYKSGPGGIAEKDTSKVAAPPPVTTPQQALNQGAGYYGDPNDPAYGSFTKPFDVQSFYQNLDPSYFWRLQQGQQAVVNGNAAGSGALSGSAMKDLLNYNQNAASQEYGNTYNRYQTTQGNIFSRLAEMAGLGQSAAAGVGANGVALAGQAGQAVQNAGSATGAGIVGGANAISNGLTNYGAYQYLNQPRQWGGSQPTVSP